MFCAQANFREQLAEIRREVDGATEQRYLDGLKRFAEHKELYASLTDPLFEPEIEEMPAPMQDEDSGEVIEPLEPRSDLGDTRAEGSGHEVLLQASTQTLNPNSSTGHRRSSPAGLSLCFIMLD